MLLMNIRSETYLKTLYSDFLFNTQKQKDLIMVEFSTILMSIFQEPPNKSYGKSDSRLRRSHVEAQPVCAS